MKSASVLCIRTHSYWMNTYSSAAGKAICFAIFHIAMYLFDLPVQ